MTMSPSYSTLCDARRPNGGQPSVGTSPATTKRRLTFRSAVRAISLISLLASLSWVEQLLAAGFGAVLIVLGAIVALQLLALLAFYLVGLLPTLEAAQVDDESFGQARLAVERMPRSGAYRK